MSRALVLSRNARLRWDACGRLVAEGARSVEPLEIDSTHLAVLDAFARPTDPEIMLEGRLECELDPKRRDRTRLELSTLIDRLRRIGVLVAADGSEAVGVGYFADPQRQLM